MSISTFAELQTAIAGWLNRDDLTARIPDFIALNEAAINRTLRITRMHQRASATISTDNHYSSVPTNFLEAITYSLSKDHQTWRLEPAPVEVLADYRAANDSAGVPRFYAITGTATGREFEHYPTPDAAYEGTLTFFAKAPALSVSSPTNWLLTDAPDAYLYGSLLQAAPYLRDAEYAAVWSAGYTAALEGLKAMERTKVGKLRTDIALSSRSGVYDVSRDI